MELLKQMESALAAKSDHALPLEFFRDILEDHFPDAEVQRQLDTVLNWGRYADIVTVDSGGDRSAADQGVRPTIDCCHLGGRSRPDSGRW